MDFTYYLEDACRVEVYVGRLKCDIEVCGDENELVWIDVSEDFFDMSRFAGEGNICNVLLMNNSEAIIKHCSHAGLRRYAPSKIISL
jgi:8-oxo-dGTP diphosphatase